MTSRRNPPTPERWADVLRGKVVLVGIGNALRGDDGFGPCLVERLRDHVPAVCLDVGAAPENYAGRIARENPDTILLADAVHLNRAPGEYALLGIADILRSGFTTHDMSPHLFIEYLEVHTRAAIYLLGLQPKSLSLGTEMSEPVRRAVRALATQIGEALRTALPPA